ncbi:glycosyltransferase family 4 protein, partial [bacterium]|nr:glycosyltransferase family 4 protein [bacterium]
MKKTSIVHIQLLPILSGVQKSMIDFITRLDRDKYDITVICQCQGQLVDVLRKHQIKVLFIPELRRQINPYYDLIAFIKLYRLFKTQKYDVVHTHSSKPGFLGRLAAKTAKTKAIVHTVQGFAFHEFSSRISTVVFTFLEKIAALVSDIIISVNEYDRRIAIERRIVKRDKIITIPNGICLEEFTINIDVEDKKRQLGIAPNKKVVGMVARLWAQKAPQVFIKAAAYVLERRKDVVFLLVGDGELKSELELLVGELGIEKDVLFTGWRTDVPQILEILDIFLLTSLWEGLPITILEAMVKRKPVVA